MWNAFGSMVNNGLIGVVLSSIETRFGLTSTESSWIVTTYDVAGESNEVIVQKYPYLIKNTPKYQNHIITILSICMSHLFQESQLFF